MVPARVQLPLFGAFGEAYNWTEGANLRTRLEVVGLDNHDDGLDLELRPHLQLMHDASRVYAEGVVDAVYADDQAVAGDSALQAFVWDLCSDNGGNIQGLCGDGQNRSSNGLAYLEEPLMPTKSGLSGLLGDALSGIFLLHGFVHSRALFNTMFIPFAPTNMRPNFMPRPESVCSAQDVVDAFGDHEDWRRHILFWAQVFTPVMGHLTSFRGHYSIAVGGGGGADDPLSTEKDALFDAFVDTIEVSLKSFDADTGVGIWPQLGAWINI